MCFPKKLGKIVGISHFAIPMPELWDFGKNGSRPRLPLQTSQKMDFGLKMSFRDNCSLCDIVFPDFAVLLQLLRCGARLEGGVISPQLTMSRTAPEMAKSQKRLDSNPRSQKSPKPVGLTFPLPDLAFHTDKLQLISG